MINYTKTTWVNNTTVIDANGLNNMETGIDALVTAVNTGGTVGPAGPAGADGAAATVDVGTITTGDAGSNATVSNSGTTSAAVFDFVIPRGADGAAGAQGPKGDKGDKGDPGVAGAKGDPGADGTNITAIELTADAAGKVTGGTATLSDGSTVSITVTTTTV